MRPVMPIILAGAILALAACRSGDPPRRGARDGTTSQRPETLSVAEPVENDPSLDWSDPCTQNLAELAGALLIHYSFNHRFPASLEELGRAPGGQEVSLTCPKSTRRYVYRPEGLSAPRDMMGRPMVGTLLILYDAEPSHVMKQHVTDGNRDYVLTKPIRYGIVVEPLEPNRPVKLFVVPVEQNLLDLYLRGGSQQAPGGASPVPGGRPAPVFGTW